MPISDLPTEIFQLIFGFVTSAPNVSWDETRLPPHEPNLAFAPYRLASVSSIWRRTVLQTPELWSYLDIFVSSIKGLEQYVALNLERSGAVPLVVVMTHDPISSHHTRAMTMLADHADRWRRLRLHALERGDALVDWTFFGLDTPLLEEIVVTSEPRLILGPIRLPYTPKIVRGACIPFHLALPRPTQGKWIHLEYLTVNLRHTTNAPLWDAIAHAPNLRELQVFFPFLGGQHEPAISPPSNLVLPRLHSLAFYGHSCLDFSSWSDRWHCPRLRNITASSYGCYKLRGFFARFARQITHLRLQYEQHSDLGSDDALAVLQLTTLEELHISAAPFDYDIPLELPALPFDHFFETLGSEAKLGALGSLRRFIVLGRVRVPAEDMEELNGLERLLHRRAFKEGGQFHSECEALDEWREQNVWESPDSDPEL